MLVVIIVIFYYFLLFATNWHAAPQQPPIIYIVIDIVTILMNTDTDQCSVCSGLLFTLMMSTVIDHANALCHALTLIHMMSVSVCL